MSTLTDLTSKEFLTALASSAPAPGGGGGAAMAGALAAALSSMVANLTLGKEKFAPVEPEIKELENPQYTVDTQWTHPAKGTITGGKIGRAHV